VRRTALVHVHREVRPATHQRARRARVVEVDMGEQEGLRAHAGKPREQRLLARLGPRVDEDAVDLEAGDHLLAPAMQDVDLPHPPRRVRKNRLQ
jgi:hypothetical protein